MKNVLPIILILVGGAGIYFSIVQQNEFEKTIAAREALEEENTARVIVRGEKEEERDAAEKEVAKMNEQRGMKLALVNSENDKNQTLTAQAEELNTQYLAKQAQHQKILDELDAYDFKDPQEIIDRNDQAKEKNTQLLASLEEMNVLVDAAAKKTAGQEAQLSTLQDRQQEYRKKLANNSREYRVVAVDPEWGFVVVNAGEDSTITPQSVLLVSRDNKSIAKLKVSSLEKRQTVADLVEGTLADGNRVEVGDKVILLNPQG